MDKINHINLSKYRIQKSLEDLQAAELLYKNGLYAQSLNRSYYAIFHSMRALPAYESIDFRKHSAIISYFNRNYIKNEKMDKEYSRIIMKAERLRNKSDYNDFYIVSMDEAKEQLKAAKQFIENIDRYLKRKQKH